MSTVQVKDKDAKIFVAEFLEEYLSSGFGAKSKRDIDILEKKEKL